jgi:hypothetical protein
MSNNRGGKSQALIIVGAVVVGAALAPVVTPVLLHIGGISAAAGKLPPQVLTSSCGYQLSPRELLGTMAAAKVATGSAFVACSMLATYVVKHSRFRKKRVARPQLRRDTAASEQLVRALLE